MNPDIVLPVPDSRLSVDTYLCHVWHLFVIRNPERDRLRKFLSDKGIQTLIHYPIPPHKQNAYKSWNHLSLPVTEQIHSEVLSLPMSQVLEDSQVGYIIKWLNKFRL